MSKGGFENPAYDPDDDWWEDDDDNTGGSAVSASTPGPNGEEEIQMQTKQHEKSGQPEASCTETSFGVPTLSEQARVAAKDLFPDKSSSELEVSYNLKGRLQVKMFGVGKKLYPLTTTEKSTGRQQINKKLPKEIKNALGSSKYEKVQQTIYEKRKELKEEQYVALQKEKGKKNG